MRRACVLLVPVAAACNFQSPSSAVDGGPGDASPDAAAERRCDHGGTWEKGKQPTKTVHVSVTPGPGTPDGSQANPFTTIGSAVPSIEPGTRILLGPGDHGGVTITNKRGTADAPIWIEGPQGGTPARIGGGTGAGIHLVGAQYWVIRNLTVSGLTQQAGINVDDGSSPGSAHHIVVERVTIGSVNRACVQVSGATDVTIRDSTLGGCERGVMLLGVQRAAIARMNLGGFDTAGVALAGGSDDIEVRQSTIANVQNGIGIWIGGDSTLGQFRPPLAAPTGNTEARNVRVFDNVIRDVGDAVMCSNCTTSLVAHNLIRRVTGFVFRLDQSYTAINTFAFAPAGGVAFLNNAIEIGSSAEAMSDADNGTDAASCMFGSNLWLKDGSVWTPALPTAETMGIYGEPSGYSDGGRLCASTSSRAAGAGTPLVEVNGTIKGECRPSPPSIGPGEPEGC